MLTLVITSFILFITILGFYITIYPIINKNKKINIFIIIILIMVILFGCFNTFFEYNDKKKFNQKFDKLISMSDGIADIKQFIKSKDSSKKHSNQSKGDKVKTFINRLVNSGIIEIISHKNGMLYINNTYIKKLETNEIFKVTCEDEGKYYIKFEDDDRRISEDTIDLKIGRIYTTTLPKENINNNKFGTIKFCTPDFEGTLFIDSNEITKVEIGQQIVLPNIPVGVHEIKIVNKIGESIRIIDLKEGEVKCVSGASPKKPVIHIE